MVLADFPVAALALMLLGPSAVRVVLVAGGAYAVTLREPLHAREWGQRYCERARYLPPHDLYWLFLRP